MHSKRIKLEMLFYANLLPDYSGNSAIATDEEGYKSLYQNYSRAINLNKITFLF